MSFSRIPPLTHARTTMAGANLQVSDELKSLFRDACGGNGGNVRALRAVIQGEAIVSDPENPTIAMGESAEGDFQTITNEVAGTRDPKYYIFAMDSEARPEFVLIAFVPEDANVRSKMLYASCHKDLVRQLGTEKFKSEWYCNDPAEMVYSGLVEQLKQELAAVPLTEEEILKNAEQAESVGKAQSSGNMGSLPFEATKELLTALENFKSNDVNFVEIKMDEQEKLDHVSSKVLGSAAEIDTNILSDQGRFYTIRYPPTPDGTGKSFFVFCCPDDVKIKERMILATVKSTAIEICKGCGVSFVKQLEINDTAVETELASEIAAMADTRELKNTQAFSKPSRPGRGKRRMVTKK